MHRADSLAEYRQISARAFVYRDIGAIGRQVRPQVTRLNDELASAKAVADAANLSKTRFIAAASHDILQPLNAARLFTSSLVERMKRSKDSELVRNVDSSLEAVEDILNALLDISRLDAGAMKAETAPFRIDDILQALALEYGPAARKKGLRLTVVASRLSVDSDRRLLRRILQNFVSNAVKYTREGRVLMGCRRRGAMLRIVVHDTGPGIPESKRDVVFQEFQRLQTEGDGTAGLGLGLSIVERIAKVLDAPITRRSRPGRGSAFAVELPHVRRVAALEEMHHQAGVEARIRVSRVCSADEVPSEVGGPLGSSK